MILHCLACGSVPSATNGTFITNGTDIVDDTATLECDVGFVRSTANDPEATIVCQSDGQWSSTDATCIRSKIVLFYILERDIQTLILFRYSGLG